MKQTIVVLVWVFVTAVISWGKPTPTIIVIDCVIGAIVTLGLANPLPAIRRFYHRPRRFSELLEMWVRYVILKVQVTSPAGYRAVKDRVWILVRLHRGERWCHVQSGQIYDDAVPFLHPRRVILPGDEIRWHFHNVGDGEEERLYVNLQEAEDPTSPDDSRTVVPMHG
jgi:hypothetical protein